MLNALKTGKNKTRLSSFSFIVLFAFVPFLSFSQNLPVGTPAIEDYYRRLQLTGKIDSSLSFTIRPLNKASFPEIENIYDPAKTLENDAWLSTNQNIHASNQRIKLQILPIIWKQQFNSHHPYGWNDGAMKPAKGYQTLFSAGLAAQWGPLHIQLAPEITYAANRDFNTLGPRTRTDVPERFGDDPYSKFYWGQSSISLNFGPASIGLSNENMWWGPGQRSSLLMSNNAPGFKHITINTTKPIRTAIGSFEGQVIGGKLESSGIAPYDDTYTQNQWRYLSAMNVSYQPKWLPGVFFGFIRNFIAYHDDIEGVGGWIPFLEAFQKKNTDDGDPFPRDQILSFYTRWVFEKAKAEVYLEYGINDHSHDFREFIGGPDHSRTYLFGFTKFIPFKQRADEFIQVNAELTQLSQSIDRTVRNAGSWYTHSQIKHGYTHFGQIIGAGMDLGANIQTLDVSWVKEMKKIGVLFERYEHNPHDSPRLLQGRSRRWVDFGIGGVASWDYKNLLLNAKLQGIKSFNYQWVLKEYTPDLFYIPHNDVFNFHGEIGLAFRF